MVRFDFPGFAHSVITYAGKGYGITQLSLFESMFAHYSDEVITATRAADGYDSGHVSAYVSGRRNIPKPMVAFYFKPANRSKLEDDISSFLSLLGSGQNGLVAVIRRNLLSEYPLDPVREDIANRQYPDGIGGNAAFLADAVLYAMSRPSLPRDRSGNLIGSAIVLKDHFLLLPPPKPPIAFAGRAADLVDLNDKLDADLKVNLFGPPGIGKSALAAAHVSSSAYKNILWITYTGDLRRDIAQLERIDKATLNTLGDRYDANMRIISLMASDSLIVIDQYDASTCDAVLPLLLGLSCRVLVVSRHPLSDYDCAHVCLDAIANIDDCLNIIRHYYKATDAYRNEITDMIQITHHHTTVMILCAKLLQDGAVTPDTLLSALRASAALPDNTDNIPLVKDGLMMTDTYIGHISTLLGLAKLSHDETELLQLLSVIHLDHAVTDLQVCHLLQMPDLNALNMLVCRGLIDKDADDRTLSISPLVAQVAIAMLHPDPCDCIRMIGLVSVGIAAYQVVYGTINNVLAVPYLIDNPGAYFDGVEVAIYAVLQYQDLAAASQYLQCMDHILADGQACSDDIQLKHLACSLLLATDADHAADLLAKASALADDFGVSGSHYLACMHINLANQLISRAAYNEASHLLSTAVSLLADAGLLYTIDAFSCYLSIAYTYAATGHCDDCRQLLDLLAAVEIRSENQIGPAYIEAANFKYSLGTLYCSLGDYQQARDLFDAAAVLYDAVYPGQPDIMRSIKSDMQAHLDGQPTYFGCYPFPSVPGKIKRSLEDN